MGHGLGTGGLSDPLGNGLDDDNDGAIDDLLEDTDSMSQELAEESTDEAAINEFLENGFGTGSGDALGTGRGKPGRGMGLSGRGVRRSGPMRYDGSRRVSESEERTRDGRPSTRRSRGPAGGKPSAGERLSKSGSPRTPSLNRPDLFRSKGESDRTDEKSPAVLENEKRGESTGKGEENNTETTTSGKGKDSGKQDESKKTKPKKNQPNKKTWKRSHLIPNTSRLMVGDDAELPISGMQANVEIDGFRARVLLDIYFHNDRDRNLEGNFQIRLPVGASLYFFAFGETSYSYRGNDRPRVQQVFFNIKDDRRFGNSPQQIMAARSDSWRSPKEARMVPREKAAFAYRSTVRRRVDPALVEWAGAGMFNAKIFPITPKRLHRVVIGYDMNLQTVGDELVYRLDVPRELPQLSVDLNVSALAGMNAEVTPKVKPFTSGGRAYYRYDNPQQSSLAVRFSKPGVVLLSDKTDQTGPYFATRFHVDLPKEPASEDEIDQAAQSHRFQPWQLAGVDVAGGSDLLLAGRPRTIYPGQQLLLTGRGTPAADAKISLKLRRGDEVKTISISIDRTIESDLASRAYGQVATGSLENILPLTEDVATAYARHFRVTGQSCSLLMLESEADYERFDIKPQDDAFVVKSTLAGRTIDKAFDNAAKLLSDPKAMFSKWLARLEKMPGLEFRASAAMKIAVDNLPASAFEVSAGPLVCRDHSWKGVSDKLRGQLASGKLNYDSVISESSQRTDSGANADALRGISSLVEMNPGNLSLARDVAYSALEWDQPGQAYHLLRRVAMARPYEPQTLLAMARSLVQMGNSELAVLIYEVALSGTWDNRFGDFNYITSVDYLHLLRKLQQQQYSGPLRSFVDARRSRLTQQVKIKQGDLLVTILWNTDGTDVDLHINEPSGEVCFYSHRNTKSGGRMTSDVTQGFGPELYVLRNAPVGKYGISVKYFSADTNRAGTRTRVYATIYEGWGTKSERVFRKAVLLKTGKPMHQVLTVGIEK